MIFRTKKSFDHAYNTRMLTYRVISTNNYVLFIGYSQLNNPIFIVKTYGVYIMVHE